MITCDRFGIVLIKLIKSQLIFASTIQKININVKKIVNLILQVIIEIASIITINVIIVIIIKNIKIPKLRINSINNIFITFNISIIKNYMKI